MMMTEILYDWVFEIASITTGSFGIIEAAAMGVLINVVFLFTPAVSCFYIAIAIRMSNLLGDRDVVGAKRSMWLCLQSGCVVAFVFGGLMIVMARILPRIFTSDDEVIDVCAEHMPLVAIDFALSAFTYVVQGILFF